MQTSSDEYEKPEAMCLGGGRSGLGQGADCAYPGSGNALCDSTGNGATACDTGNDAANSCLGSGVGALGGCDLAGDSAAVCEHNGSTPA